MLLFHWNIIGCSFLSVTQQQKAIVTPTWITESIARQKRLPCGEYVAVCALEKCTTEHCPDHGVQASQFRSVSSPPPASPKNISYMSRFAVQRASPLVCPNQAMVVQLDVIRNARALDGDERSAMSYSRSIAAIKGATCISWTELDILTCQVQLIRSSLNLPNKSPTFLIWAQNFSRWYHLIPHCDMFIFITF
ncbi:hypothetical protein JB92DRAFT_3017861 [Gautieria morchelliformis]|nr:hypothetical protein JB92DRAFT_3017861 [Gautieria morchelliformis]